MRTRILVGGTSWPLPSLASDAGGEVEKAWRGFVEGGKSKFRVFVTSGFRQVTRSRRSIGRRVTVLILVHGGGRSVAHNLYAGTT